MAFEAPLNQALNHDGILFRPLTHNFELAIQNTKLYEIKRFFM